MDGQTYQSKTITGVVLGATAAGTSAVFKVNHYTNYPVAINLGIVLTHSWFQ